jgi:RNA polymerase sigma-70 factor (ECF subfamily)
MLKTAANGSQLDRSGVFRTTHWTEILDAGSEDEPRRQAALEDLIGSYWKPVYCFLRRKGHPHEEAKDLTQGFFYEIVLGRNLFHQADRAKGRFRTFLLTALERYTVSIHRSETTRQRVPEGGLLRTGEIDGLNVLQPVDYGSPDEAFDYAWAVSLLDEVFAEVSEQCHRKGKTIHWEVFQERVVKPIMENTEAPSLIGVCEKYGISNRVKASKMTIAVTRRFRTTLRRRLRQFVSTAAEVDDEIRYLMRIFSRNKGKSA